MGDLVHSASGSVPVASGWQPIATAPKDGTRFWGLVDEDAIGMLWHDEFEAFVSSWRQMVMAPGYTIDGKSHRDHSPVKHSPTQWRPLELPA